MNDISTTVNEWMAQNRPIALATVAQTWGSSPRAVGAKMAVTDEMAMTGSVSGGCVETAVISEAIDSLNDGKPRLLQYGVSDDVAWNVGLTCGGKIAIFVEPLDQKWWKIATEQIQQQRPMMLVTVVEGDLAGQKMIIGGQGEIRYVTEGLAADQQRALVQTALDAYGGEKSGQTQVGDLNVLVEVHRAKPRLIIIGGVHVAIPLKNFAQQLGFQVAIIDPRKVFATPERFPDVDSILYSYPDKALPELGLDRDTYVAVLTHDPKIDDPALITALPSSAAYIGVLSSSRTHEKRRARLEKAGVNPQLFSRIRTPIGLDIGAKTPEEIALCIMAEIVAVRNGALV